MSSPTGFERKTFSDGTVLYKEGDPPGTVYLVESGLVDILIRRPDGETTVIGTVGKGEMFGGIALIENKPHMATARVSLMATLACIPPDAFRAQMKTVNPVMSRVMQEMAKRLRVLAHELALAKSK